MDKKFRAWDKATNRMLADGFHILGETNCFQVIEQKLMEEPLGRLTLDRLGDVEIVQWSGFRDRNGVDIYQGDLIEVERKDDKIIVECKLGTIERQMATGFLVQITGFYFEREDGCQTFPIVKNYCDKNDLDVFNVIGSIFTTPELLK